MQEFIEKQSPFVVSVLLHALLILVLWTTMSEPPRSRDSMLPILMHMAPLPDQAAPGKKEAEQQTQVQQTAPNPSEQPPSQLQQTSPDVTEEKKPEVALDSKQPEEKQEQPPVPQEQPTEIEPKPPQPTPTPSPTGDLKITPLPLDEKTIEEFRATIEKTEAQQQAQKSSLMSQLTTIAETDGGQGVKRPYLSVGSERGTLREIAMDGYPKQMQQRFFARYRIKIQEKLVQGGPSQSYVNAVSTERGTYLNSGGSGYFEVMTLSKEVLARMAQLEEQELRKRNLAPERSLVREIVFGLREEPDGQVDLFVTRFRAEPIQ